MSDLMKAAAAKCASAFGLDPAELLENMLELAGTTGRAQAERLALRPPRAELQIRKAAWLAPQIGAEFWAGGERWRVEAEPVDEGDAWKIVAINLSLIYACSFEANVKDPEQ